MEEKSCHPTVEVLLSCMHQEGFDIAYRTKIDSDVLIINQCGKDGYDEITVNGHTWRMMYTQERGAARSRNMALENARGDYLLFCDDDEELSDGYAKIIIDAFKATPKASGVVFNVNRKNIQIPKKYYVIKKIRKAPSYRGYGTPMLAICRKKVAEKKIRMDERFGPGEKWSCGEDSIFEVDMRKNGLHIYENPAIITTIDYSQGSTWFHGRNEEYFYLKGAYAERVYGLWLSKMARIYYTAYRLRKGKELSFFQKIKWMKYGMKGYKKNASYTEFLEQINRDKK